MNGLIYGVGVNDADYSVSRSNELPKSGGKRCRKLEWECPFYVRWKSMLTRCYSKTYQKVYTTYKECYVCEEWLTFSNFKVWMETQDWEGKELDKDLLGNGKVYSPETCCFLNRKLNAVLRKASGVSVKKGYKNKKYVSQISMAGKRIHLGYFYSEDEAKKVYLDKRDEIVRLFIKEESLEVQERWLDTQQSGGVETTVMYQKAKEMNKQKEQHDV